MHSYPLIWQRCLMQNVVLNLSMTLISKIHQMVYEIYGLTKEEIEISELKEECVLLLV